MEKIVFPDFGNSEVWEPLGGLAVHYNRQRDEAPGIFIRTIVVGSSIRPLEEIKHGRHIGIILGYRARENHQLVGRSLSFFDGPAAFLMWGVTIDSVAMRVAMRVIVQKQQSRHEGKIYIPPVYSTEWIEAEPGGHVKRHLTFADKGGSVVSQIFLSFYTKAGKLYHLMFFENPAHPAATLPKSE